MRPTGFAGCRTQDLDDDEAVSAFFAAGALAAKDVGDVLETPGCIRLALWDAARRTWMMTRR